MDSNSDEKSNDTIKYNFQYDRWNDHKYVEWRGLYTYGECGVRGTRVVISPTIGRVWSPDQDGNISFYDCKVCGSVCRIDCICCTSEAINKELDERGWIAIGYYHSLRNDSLDSILEELNGKTDTEIIGYDKLIANIDEFDSTYRVDGTSLKWIMDNMMIKENETMKDDIYYWFHGMGHVAFLQLKRSEHVIAELEQINQKLKAEGVTFHWI